MGETEFTTFLARAMGRLAAHSEDGSLHYVCMDWRHLGEVLDAGREVYSEFKNLCVWAKDNAGMGSLRPMEPTNQPSFFRSTESE